MVGKFRVVRAAVFSQQAGWRILALSFVVLLSFVALISFSSTAKAQQCYMLGSTNLDFGTVDLSTGAPQYTTGTFGVLCLGIFGRTIRICPNYNAGTGGVSAGGDPRQMLSGINQLNYNIFKDAAYSQVWGSHVWANPPTPPTLDIPLTTPYGGGGYGIVNYTIRARIPAGQSSVPPGLYTSSFAGTQTQISGGYSIYGNCATLSAFGGGQVPFTVTANVIASCNVSATDLNFGSVGSLATNIDTTNVISVTCSSGTPYSISLNGGLSGAINPELRQMSFGANQITYGIYQNAARTIPWGDLIGTNTLSSVGTGLTQSFTAYGRVPIQPTPPTGTYNDTIIVTVTY